jgi:hypothetical protein
MAILNFDSTKVEAGEFELIPVGEYRAVVTNSEMKTTKDNPNNKYLTLTLEIIDGEFKGRKLFENLNLIRDMTAQNDPKTKGLAERRLKQICQAVGKTHIKDSAELHNKPMLVDVVIEAGSGTYKDRNAIKKFAPLGPVAPHEPPQPAQEEPAGVMPWEV